MEKIKARIKRVFRDEEDVIAIGAAMDTQTGDITTFNYSQKEEDPVDASGHVGHMLVCMLRSYYRGNYNACLMDAEGCEEALRKVAEIAIEKEKERENVSDK